MTNKEAITRIKDHKIVHKMDEPRAIYISKALDMAIKALEQEPITEILDKIRAEIEKAVWEDVIVSLDGTDEVRIPCLDPDDVFEIIDKYKTENEE